MIVAFDTETCPILPGLLAPPLVCGSFADEDGSRVENARDTLETFRTLLTTGRKIVTHNGPYDLAVAAVADPSLLPLIFEAADDGRVVDTQIREQLLDIGTGNWRTTVDAEGNTVRSGYSLADLARKYLGKEMDKTTWRLGYGKLRSTPLSEWPEGAIKYAREDAETTLAVWRAQEKLRSPGEPSNLDGEAAQVRAAFALHLMSVYGMRTDPVRVARLGQELTELWETLRGELKASGIFRADGTRNVGIVKELVLAAETSGKGPFERTPKGAVKTDVDTLLGTGDPLLAKLAEASGVQKTLGTFVPVLKKGTVVPINARYYVLARSGRTSCASPNMQNLPKEEGVRDCFVPRPGFVFAFADYSILELRCLAQVLLWTVGKSRMASALNDGRELHLELAAEILGIPYAEAKTRFDAGDGEIKEARQLAKVPNFGFPGGMGAATLVDFAKATGVKITLPQAEELRRKWFEAWPEMRDYFAYVAKIIGHGGRVRAGSVRQFVTGRIRGGVGFTDGCNTLFQGLAADGAKAAAWAVTKACHDPSSPLHGSRPVVFVHDEIGLESPRKKADGAVRELEKIMVVEMKKFTPDIPIEAKGVLMTRWSKAAERIEREGKIIPWGEAC